MHRGWLESVVLSSRSFRERQANGASHPQQVCLSIRGKVRCLRRHNSCPPSPSRSEGGGWQFNGARGVCCCSPTSLAPAPVSALSIPHFRTPTQMPCTHPHAKTPFRSGLIMHTLTLASLASPFPRIISVRDGRAAKPQTARGFSSSPTTISSASRAAREVGEALRTRWSVPPSHTPV